MRAQLDEAIRSMGRWAIGLGLVGAALLGGSLAATAVGVVNALEALPFSLLGETGLVAGLVLAILARIGRRLPAGD